jgi:HlyD family secretion protein
MKPDPVKSTWRAMALGIVVSVTVAMASNTSLAEESDDAVNAALTVSTVAPFAISWPNVVFADGAITPWQEASVSAEISGARLIEVLVDVGDQVEAGQLLARFDDGPARAMLAQHQASVADAEARLLEAAANEERSLTLLEKNSISEQDLVRARTSSLAAKAQVDLAQARLASQQLVLDNTRVIAPDAGVVSSRKAMLGAVAVPGLELFRLIRQNRLEWRAELIASDLGSVARGNHAEVQMPDGSILSGSVRQVAPQLDGGTRTGLVYVALNSEDAAGSARAGMFASGRIVVGERDGIALPSTAVVYRDGYEFVFLVDDESGRVAQVKVRSGRRFADSIEIVEGLSLQDQVVESGGAFLNDGDRVRIVRPPAGSRLGAAG